MPDLRDAAAAARGRPPGGSGGGLPDGPVRGAVGQSGDTRR